jgi:hypothetical protein
LPMPTSTLSVAMPLTTSTTIIVSFITLYQVSYIIKALDITYRYIHICIFK